MPTLSIDIQARLASFQDSLGRVERQVGGLAGKLDSAFSGLSSTLGALAGAAGVAALTKFVQQGIDAADALDDVAQKTGIAVEALSELGFAAKIEGINVEAFGGSITKLNVNLQAAAQGSKEMQQAFAAVGISAEQIATIRPDEAFRRIAEAFAGMEDGAQKSAIAVRLFGKSGADLIPLLNAGASGLARSAEEARRFGLVVSAETAAAAANFNDNLTRLKASAEGLGFAISETVLPTFSRFVEELLAGQRIAGSFVEAIGLFGIRNPFQSAQENLKSLREELEGLQRARDRFLKSNADTSALDSAIVAVEKRIQFARLQVEGFRQPNDRGAASARNAGSALQLARRNAALGGDGSVTENANAVQAEVADGAERGARIFAQIYLDQFNVLRQQAREIQSGLMDIFEAGNRADAAEIERQASALEALLSGTRSGQEASAIRDIETLNNALIVGKLSAEQYEEAYALIEARLNSIRGVSTSTFEQLSDDGTQALRDLQFAVEGWGRNFTDTLATALETGKLNFSDLVRSVLRDLVRLQIQQSITRPLFQALSGALGNVNLFGSGSSGTPSSGIGFGAGQGLQLSGRRANGGPVSAGRAYLVGERGPEILVPRNSGTVLPNGMGMGGGLTQVFNIAPGIDAGTVYRAAQMGATMAKSDIARSMRIGEVG